MKSSSVRAIAFLSLALAVGCGLENSVVGGRCRDGMLLQGGSCITPADPTLITPRTPPTGTTSAAPIMPSGPTASVPSAAPPFPTVTAPENPVTALPPEETTCLEPLVLCHGVCIPAESDAENCGACGKICPSNICVNGECQGATPGDVVLIGHDYTNAFVGSAQSKVLVNTLSIPTTDPIRILSFEDGADPAAVAQLRSLATASIKDRQVMFTRAAAASSLASATLGRNYDVVIINDASAVDPVATGARWAAPLNTFAAKGGVVLAIDLGTSAMPQLLSSAGLFTMTGHTTLPVETHLMVTAAADVVGAQVLSPYAAFSPPVSFQGMAPSSPDFNWVVRVTKPDDSAGDPVVVHRIVR